MRNFAKTARPIVLTGSILTLLISIIFVVITFLNPEFDFNQFTIFCLVFGISTRCFTIVNFVMSILASVSAFMSGNLRVLSVVTALFSVPGFILGFQLAPICTKESISETFGLFGSGADIITPMVFIGIASLVLLILTAVGISKSNREDMFTNN